MDLFGINSTADALRKHREDSVSMGCEAHAKWRSTKMFSVAKVYLAWLLPFQYLKRRVTSGVLVIRLFAAYFSLISTVILIALCVFVLCNLESFNQGMTQTDATPAETSGDSRWSDDYNLVTADSVQGSDAPPGTIATHGSVSRVDNATEADASTTSSDNLEWTYSPNPDLIRSIPNGYRDTVDIFRTPNTVPVSGHYRGETWVEPYSRSYPGQGASSSHGLTQMDLDAHVKGAVVVALVIAADAAIQNQDLIVEKAKETKDKIAGKMRAIAGKFRNDRPPNDE